MRNGYEKKISKWTECYDHHQVVQVWNRTGRGGCVDL